MLKTPDNIQMINDNPIDWEYCSTPLGETKIPEPTITPTMIATPSRSEIRFSILIPSSEEASDGAFEEPEKPARGVASSATDTFTMIYANSCLDSRKLSSIFVQFIFKFFFSCYHTAKLIDDVEIKKSIK